MIRTTVLRSVLIAALLLAGCSSDAAKGSRDSDGDATTTVGTTGDSTADTTGPDDTDAPATSAEPSTTVAAETTAPPTTIPCRNVGDLYAMDPADVLVRRGDCGEGVRQIQTQLNYKLFITLEVDGRFGPGTEAAVRDFQTGVGIEADGIVGMQTWVALNDDGT